MMNLKTLPRVEPNYQCKTFREAVEEVERRGASPAAVDSTSRIVESPFGGFRVFTVSRRWPWTCSPPWPNRASSLFPRLASVPSRSIVERGHGNYP